MAVSAARVARCTPVSREELAIEREAFLERRRKAMPPPRAPVVDDLPEELPAGVKFTASLRHQYRRDTCVACQQVFYPRRTKGRPIRRCSKCRG